MTETDEPPRTTTKGMVNTVKEVTDKALLAAEEVQKTTQMQEKNINRNSFVTWLNLLLIVVLGLVVFGLTWQVQSRNRNIDQISETIVKVETVTQLAVEAANLAATTAEQDRIITSQALEEIRLLQQFAENRVTSPEAQAAAARTQEALASIAAMRSVLERLAMELCGPECLGG